MPLTLPEALEKVEQLDAKIKTFEAEAEARKTAEAETKKAEGEAKKDAEAKKAEAEDKEKMAEAKKMMKAAYDEKDPEKVREKIAEAYKHMGGEAKKAEADDDEDKKEEDEEKEAMKAELKRPRLQILTASYKGRVDDKTLQTFTAQWNKMTFTQLDAEIEKVKPFIAKAVHAVNTATATPLGIGTTLPTSFSAKKEDEFSAKMKDMTVNELFGGSD